MAETTAPTITLFEGNVVAIPFRLRRKTIQGFFDVSAATEIKLEADDPDGVAISPIIADNAHPKADFANGLVIIVVDANNITGQIGTWNYSLTATIDGNVITLGAGLMEVLDRPGFPNP